MLCEVAYEPVLNFQGVGAPSCYESHFDSVYGASKKIKFQVEETLELLELASKSAYGINFGVSGGAVGWGVDAIGQIFLKKIDRTAVFPYWIAKVQKLCQQHQLDEALREIALEAERVKERGDYSRFNRELKTVVHEKLSDVALIALLRNTFSFRANIEGWDEFLVCVEKILLTRGREPRRLLRGLKKIN